MLFYRGEKVIAPVGLIHTFPQIFFTTIRSNIVNALCFSVLIIFFCWISFYFDPIHMINIRYWNLFFLARLTIQPAWFVENVKQKTIAIHINVIIDAEKMIKASSILNLTTSWINPIASYAFLLTSAEKPNVLYFVFVSVKSFAH